MKQQFFPDFFTGVMISLILLLFSQCSSDLGSIKDPDKKDYLFGKSMELPLRNLVKLFPADNKMGNFISFDGVKYVQVTDGILHFTLDKDTAILGWGNYLGKQKIGDIEDTFQESVEVILNIKQSSDSSVWDIDFYRDGDSDPLPVKVLSEISVGNEWQEIAFESSDTSRIGIQVPEAKFDAMSFSISGKPGTEFQIEWVKLIQPVYSGYCRKEFTIPEGKIWKAVADVGSSNKRSGIANAYSKNSNNIYERTPFQDLRSTLYINGKLVERDGSKDLFFTAPVDITPYLKEGKNCVGFYGHGISDAPFLYFQTRIIMESGEVVEFVSDTDWKYSSEYEENWCLSDFNDSEWKNDIKEGKGPWVNERDVSGDYGIPAYSGCLVIKNPDNKDLFYNTTQPVKFDILVPKGLKEKSPVLSYFFGKSDSKGVSRLVNKGTVTEFSDQDGSLIYRIYINNQTEGIYTLSLRLNDSNGELIEERSREPLVILKKLNLKEIKGMSSKEGLDLELEDFIDFTDPDDPHPSKELHAGGNDLVTSAPVIKREGDMVYREVTDSLRGAGFSYDIEFKHPGSFYYFELEYPDNTRRISEVTLRSMILYDAKVWSSVESGLGVETGGRFLPTNKMQTLKWIHVPDKGLHTIDIISSMDNEKAAAKSLKIYRIKGNLPALEIGNSRNYGIHTERCFYETGIGKNFGVFVEKEGKPKFMSRTSDKTESVSLVQKVLKNLYWLKETGERYVQYLKYTGQSSHIMGCYQYSEYCTPVIFAPSIEDSRVVMCTRTMMANIFDVNDINFYAGIEFSQSQDVKTYANDAQVAQGAETAYMVDAEGKQKYGFYYSYIQNWLYPETKEKYNLLMERIGRTYGHLSHFKGVHNLNTIETRYSGYYLPGIGVNGDYGDPLNISFDDITITMFEKETGVNMGISLKDPKRFTKRAEFLKKNSNARKLFLSWRSDKYKEFISNAVEALRKGTGRDVDMLNVLLTGNYTMFQYLYKTGKPFAELTKELAYDIPKVNSVDGVWTGRWTISWRHWFPRPPHRNPYVWMARTDPSFISAFERDSNRFVFVRSSWDENNYDGGRIRSLPLPGGYHCREAYIQAIITGDPELLVGGYTDLNINVGNEQIIREVIRPFTLLPEEKFSEVLSTGLTTNVAIRKLNQKDKSYFYIANPCQWSIEGSIKVENSGEIFDLVSGESVVVENGEIKISLDPFGLLAYRSTSPELDIIDYNTESISEEDLARLTGVVSQFEENIAMDDGLDSDDKEYLNPFITGINKAIEDNEYAKAWSLLTEPRVWTLKTMMEDRVISQ